MSYAYLKAYFRDPISQSWSGLDLVRVDANLVRMIMKSAR